MTHTFRNELVGLIVNRLEESKEDSTHMFLRKHPTKVARYFTVDNLLPIEIAQNIYANFPKPGQMRKLNIPGKLKLKYSHLKDVSSVLQDINAAIQDPKVVAIVEAITGIQNQVPDPSQFAGGISMLLKGYRLNPHLDNSHDVDRKLYRTVNVLYYVSPDWCLENGGNYELWDEGITSPIVVPSLFNRLLVMETNSSSWHAVNPVRSHAPRCCVFNYYFSPQSPEAREYFFNGNSFRARPEQKIRRMIDAVKNIGNRLRSRR